MIKRIMIVGVAVGLMGLAGCKCEQESEGQATNTAAIDSLNQVISSLEQELNTVKAEKEQCEAELESLRTQAKKQDSGSKETTKPKSGNIKTVSVDKKVSADKPKQVETSEAPKKIGGKGKAPTNLNR